MKVLPFNIPKPENSSLIYQEDIELVFYDKLHEHDEIQISYLEKGSGTLLVGDGITSYAEGDIFVIGSNLPHAFKSDRNVKSVSKMLSLFFTRSSFGNSFFDLDDFSEIENCFIKSKRGFRIDSNKQSIINRFKRLKNASKLERFIILMNLLKIIASSRLVPLSNFVYEKNLSDTDGKRMRDVFDYTMEHACDPLSLDEIAGVAHMSKNAFCKYFKKRTNKTYVQFLIELRIENASKLLLTNAEAAIHDIADASGFNNISNFNRQFKRIKKMSPGQYRAIKGTSSA